MDIKIKKLIDTNAIICGKIKEEEGIIVFERIAPSQLEDIPEEERGYATLSMGRSIFNIDKNGIIHNYKGVDSHLSTTELGPMDLVNAKSVEYIRPTDEKGNWQYKVSAVVFNGGNPEIRINGVSPLEDIEIEANINRTLASMGIKVPNIQYIREIPQQFSINHGLPIKVEGNLENLDKNCDYVEEDKERKKNLQKIYGKYENLEENQQPEIMSVYLERIGLTSSPKFLEILKQFNIPIEKFITKIDEYYSRGQRYGQAERIIESPFRISDLETSIVHKNIEQLQAIMDFSEEQIQDFTNKLAENYGRNIAFLMNNGWETENLSHRQDFSLAGEFCDDTYFSVTEKQEKNRNKYEDYVAEALNNEIERRYTGQVMHIASCIKIVQEAMLLSGKSQEETDKVLQTFVESFVNNLELSKIEKISNQFSNVQSWTEEIMARQDRGEDKEGNPIIEYDNAILNVHKNNDDFYIVVARMISERMKDRQTQSKITPSDAVKNALKTTSLVQVNDAKHQETLEISEHEETKEGEIIDD